MVAAVWAWQKMGFAWMSAGGRRGVQEVGVFVWGWMRNFVRGALWAS